jgi:hypothetical protein
LSDYNDDGHRVKLDGKVMSHAKRVFDSGLQLEAILLSHEFLEQELNKLYRITSRSQGPTTHKQFKQVIDLLVGNSKVSSDEYEILNEFNRLRNVNSNLILNQSRSLEGAKRGDMIKAMNLAEESERIIEDLVSRSSQGITKRSKKSQN